MTHGPPHGILDFGHGQNLGCESLLEAVARARPRMHCFGHIHEGYGTMVMSWDEGGSEEGFGATIARAGIEKDGAAQRVKLVPGHDTLMVNAAIMDDRNQPSNAPWIVDLPLPV